MKALFCGDIPLYKDRKGKYYGLNFHDDYFQRYLNLADSLHVTARLFSRERLGEKLRLLSDPRIKVIELVDLMTVKGLLTGSGTVKKILWREVEMADTVFIRMPSLVGNFAVDIAKKMHKPYLIELVGCPWDALWNHGIKGKVLAPYSMLKTRERVKNAPYVLYVTNTFLQKRYPTNGKWIACSNVMLQSVDEEVHRKREFHIMSKTADDIIRIGTAAGLDVPYKGQKYIIHALGQLKKKGINHFEYQLVGGGTGERLFHEAKACDVEKQVKFIGQLPHEEVFSWMDELDIYCQPSKQEGLPRSVIEAMSRGVPCIGSNIAGIPELISSDYLFSHGSHAIDELCRLLNSIASSKDMQKKMAEENFQKAKEYTRDVLEKRRTEFYSDFIKDLRLT